jgi:hypothetical protein
MKIKELVKELEEKDSYKDFKKKYPDSFLSAGFFILDFENKTENLQLNFFIPSEKKIAGFEFPFKEFKIFEDKIEKMAKIDLDVVIDLDDLKEFCEDIFHQNNSAMSISKIIAILKENEWNITCMDSMLGIIRIRANSKTKEAKSFSKGSIFDIAKTIKKK